MTVMKKFIFFLVFLALSGNMIAQKIYKNDTTELTEDHTKIPEYRSYSPHGYLNRFIGFDCK